MARKLRLRTGFTTGACAAATAKAAAELLLLGDRSRSVTITLPGSKTAAFKLKTKRLMGGIARATTIKDAGDDPDITNGAEIGATVSFATRKGGLKVTGGEGVGRVTRPGLPVRPGRAAINPVPMKMIRASVGQVLRAARKHLPPGAPLALDVEVTVAGGEELAKRTLNSRLGIIGGISILGTTGIVRPLSTEAWRATIRTSINVAEAAGLDTPVFSSGRTSEVSHMRAFGFREEAYVMMGDHVEWSLKEISRHRFKGLHLAAQWAKMLKIAMGTPDTHVRAGVFSPGRAVDFLASLGVTVPPKNYNTAQEIFQNLPSQDLARRVCEKASEYASAVAGLPVAAVLVTYDRKVICRDGLLTDN